MASPPIGISFTIPEDLVAYHQEMKYGLNALYQSLPLPNATSIRLIKVLPERAGETLKCELRVVDLDECPPHKPQYTALSYTWGPPLPLQLEDPKKIWLIMIERTLCCVKENLFDCLTQFSRAPEPEDKGDLWIDALCIDQNNVGERSDQVNMMARIYQSAELVIIWLGKADEETELACQGLTALSKHQESGLGATDLDPQLVLTRFPMISRLYQRSWFLRSWVIQELLLARETRILCGRHSISWNDLATVSRFLITSTWRTRFRRHELESISSPTRLKEVQKKFRLEIMEDDLLYHLIRSRPFKAEKPKDKVYSLLGLLQAKVGDSLLYADYHLTDMRVYHDTAVHILQTSKNLLLLSQVEGEDYRNLQNLPSWVPDWSCPASIGLGVTGYVRYQADGNIPRNCTLRAENRILHLQAMSVDIATSVGDSKRDFDAETHVLAGILPRWFDILESLDPVYPIRAIDGNVQTREEVFWRTLVRDTACMRPICPAPSNMGPSFNKWILQMLVGIVKTARSKIDPGADLPASLHTGLDTLDRLASRLEASGLIPTSKEVLSCAEPGSIQQLDKHRHTSDEFETTFSHSPNLRLFRTLKGYLGLGTTSMKENDTIWIVPGSRIPLIFRGIEHSNHYRLVGGAYLHGFMQGEALVSPANDFEMIEIE